MTKVEVKPQPELPKALQTSFRINHREHPEQRLVLLPRILKLAGEFKKSKYGVKVGAELNLDVAKVNGEAVRESESNKGYEDEVEWEVKVGLDSFDDFQQKK